MKIYDSKKYFYRIVKATFVDRTKYTVEQKSKEKSTYGDFMLFPSLFRLFNKDPYEWLPEYTYDNFEEAVKKIEWLIQFDKKQYEHEHPIEISVL